MIRLFVLLLFVPALAHADSTTYNARLEGVVSCRSLNLNVHQEVTAGGTVTTLFYELKECPAGSSEPTTVVAQGNASIPTSDYTVSRQSHTLKTMSPVGAVGLSGPIQVTWRATTAQQTTFTGAWTTREGSSMTRTNEEQFHSTATPDGTVLGWPVGTRTAFISSLVQTAK